ncbi:MAG: mercury methylation corrinoid protein HgcA [Pseudomonadota bacterium]
MSDCACSNNSSCLSSQATMPSFVEGVQKTMFGDVLKVKSSWNFCDLWGNIKSRLSNFRNTYMVNPGLYAIGNPNKDSDVFVSANYKLSFDILRKELAGINAWIVVLDTKSINVWCAAGKGTFGTSELISKIKDLHLDKLLSHKKLICPQLGAVGVSAYLVKKETGFKVKFGPVLAKDIKAYIENGYKKTEEMKRINFSFTERLKIVPLELNIALKKSVYIILIVLFFFGLESKGIMFSSIIEYSLPFIILLLISIFSGSLLTSALLPILPSRSFIIKGYFLGFIITFISLIILSISSSLNIFFIISSLLFFPTVSSYLAFNLTGCTTYTSMSGVKKELDIGIWVYLGMLSISAIMLILFKINTWS